MSEIVEQAPAPASKEIVEQAPAPASKEIVGQAPAPAKIPEVFLFTLLAVIFVSLFVFSTFFIPFNLYLYFFALLFAALFIFKNPEVGLYSIIILTFVFERFFTLTPLVWDENIYKIYPLDILTIITILSFLVWRWRQSYTSRKGMSEESKLNFNQRSAKPVESRSFLISRQGVLIIIFAIFALISTIYGVFRGGTSSLAMSTFKNYALYGIFFFLTINIINTREKLVRLVKVFLVSGAFLLFFVFWGFWQGRGLWIEFTPLSTLGTRLLAPTHAFYLSLVVLFSLNLYAYKKNIFKKFAFHIILIQLLGILASLTRHLYLALFFAFLISFIFVSRQVKRNLLKIVFSQILLIVIFVAVFSWSSYLLIGEVPIFGREIIESTAARLRTISFAPEDESAYFRVFAWEKAFEEFRESPILGIGFGHKLTFDFFGYPTRIEVRELHNDFIAIGLQMGVIGFLIFLTMNFYFLISILKNLKKISEDLKPYLLGVLASFVLIVAAANFGVYFDINLLVIFYWIILGMGIVIIKVNGNKKMSFRAKRGISQLV